MLSLYIHIPFCSHHCSYCSFQVIPLDTLGEEVDRPSLMASYMDALRQQIISYGTALTKDGVREQIKTIYFGGGTPSKVGYEQIHRTLQTIEEYFDISYLEELSIEINPEPVDEMLSLISQIQQNYRHYPRLRRSIGIQSFDNEVLSDSGRAYTFQSCIDFLRRLVSLKKENAVFNIDFIAFGKWNQTRKGDRQLRNPVSLEFFANLLESAFIDSVSLYTLELFPGSKWHAQQTALGMTPQEGYGLKQYGTDDDVYEEFQILKEMIQDAGYRRYEISNYSLAGKNSIHNRVYRSMGEWLGLGTSAVSHLSAVHYGALGWEKVDENVVSVHVTNSLSLKSFLAGEYRDQEKTELLDQQEYTKERFLVWLRVMEGIVIDVQTSNLLVPNRREKITLYAGEWLCLRDDETQRLSLTDSGMDVYNSIVSELLQEL